MQKFMPEYAKIMSFCDVFYSLHLTKTFKMSKMSIRYFRNIPDMYIKAFLIR